MVKIESEEGGTTSNGEVNAEVAVVEWGKRRRRRRRRRRRIRWMKVGGPEEK